MSRTSWIHAAILILVCDKQTDTHTDRQQREHGVIWVKTDCYVAD